MSRVLTEASVAQFRLGARDGSARVVLALQPARLETIAVFTLNVFQSSPLDK